jgi:hypothetical protein
MRKCQWTICPEVYTSRQGEPRQDRIHESTMSGNRNGYGCRRVDRWTDRRACGRTDGQTDWQGRTDRQPQ